MIQDPLQSRPIIYLGRTSPFSPTCMEIMDFFLENPTLYFTPMTTALSMELSPDTVKNCMSLLFKNSYLTKTGVNSTHYHITKENMEFWRTDFKNHVLGLAELQSQDKPELIGEEDES